MRLSLRYAPGVAVNLAQLRKQPFVHERHVAAVHLQDRAGIRRIPERTQLAVEVVTGPHAAKPLELTAVDVAPGPLGSARKLVAGQHPPDDALEQADQLPLADQIEREGGLAIRIDRKAIHLHEIAGIEFRLDEVARDAPLTHALEDRDVVATDATQVGQGRRVEVEAPDPPEREQRLTDQLPEEERDHQIHVRWWPRVQLGDAHQRYAVALGDQVHTLLLACERVGLRGHDR